LQQEPRADSEFFSATSTISVFLRTLGFLSWGSGICKNSWSKYK